MRENAPLIRPGMLTMKELKLFALLLMASKAPRAAPDICFQDATNVSRTLRTAPVMKSIVARVASLIAFHTWMLSSLMPDHAAFQSCWNHVVLVAMSTIMATNATMARMIHVVGLAAWAAFHAHCAAVIRPVTPTRPWSRGAYVSTSFAHFWRSGGCASRWASFRSSWAPLASMTA